MNHCHNYEYVIVDSFKRSSGTSTNFTYNLNRSVRSINAISLEYASFSNTLLAFTTNDKLVFSEALGNFNKVITFEDKSYSIDELILHIKTQLNALGTAGYNIVYVDNTFKLIFSNPNALFKLQFSSSSIAHQLGFSPVDTLLLYTHTSNFSVSLDPTDYLLVNISGINTIITDKTTSGCFVLPVTVARSDIQTFNSQNNFTQLIPNLNLDLSSFQVVLIDDKGQVAKSTELNLKLIIKCYLN